MTSAYPIKFSFKYKGTPPKIPLIPIRFFDISDKPTSTFNAILDSGADEITIPKDLADILEYDLIRRDRRINTAGGEMKAYKTHGNFNIGRGEREVEYRKEDICVIDHDIPVLVGIKPVFNDYQIKICAYENKFTMNPKNNLLNKEVIKNLNKAKKRMAKGNFYTEEKAKKILGLE